MGKLSYKFYISLAVVCLFGIIGKIVPFGYESWNFLFENMIWFPIEISLTVFVIDKLIQDSDRKKEVDRFMKLAGDSSDQLVNLLKRKVTSIVVDASIYDENRDDNKIFSDVLSDPNKYINSKLIAEKRVVNYMQGYSKEYNYLGFIYDPCMEMHNEIEKYLNYYRIFMPAKYVDQITRLSKQIYNSGFLMNTTDSGKLANEFVVDDSHDAHKKNLKELFVSIQNFEKSLNEMKSGNYDNK